MLTKANVTAQEIKSGDMRGGFAFSVENALFSTENAYLSSENAPEFRDNSVFLSLLFVAAKL